jgi:hypothetical protein
MSSSASCRVCVSALPVPRKTSRREAFTAAPHVVVTVRLRADGSADVAHDLAAKPEAHSQSKENSSAARLLLHLQWWRRNNQVNSLLQNAQLSRESSGCHFGSLHCTRARGSVCSGRAAACGGGVDARAGAEVVESEMVGGGGAGDNGRGA